MASIRAHTTATGTTTHPQLGERMTNVEQAASGSGTLTLTDFLLARYNEDEFATPWGECRCAENTQRPDCPDRITADIEAKRRIVELHYREQVINAACGACSKAFPCPTIRALALPYAADPDYREEWRG